MRRFSPAALICVLTVAASTTDARPIEMWTYERLNNEADIVIIGTARATSDWDEPLDEHIRKRRDNLFDRLNLTGLEMDGKVTRFDVNAVIKGKIDGKQVDLVHYTVRNENDGGIHPAPVVFRKAERLRAENDTRGRPDVRQDDMRIPRYLLFLKARKDGKVEPVSGIVDSAFSAVILGPQQAVLDE